MKHQLFKKSLSTLHHLAERMQIGNPAGRAPAMVAEPGAEAKLEMPKAYRQLSVWQLKNALCSGLYSGAVISENNQVFDRFTAFPWGKELHPSLCSPYLGRKVGKVGKAVFLMTPRAKANYYHWIADLLPRLLLVQKCGLEDFSQRWIILHHPSRGYEEDTFRLLGIAPDRLIRLHPFQTLQVEDLLVADYLHSRDGQSFPFWKRRLLEEFKEKVLGAESKSPFRKVYLLRGPQRTRRLIGEERLVAMLRELDFEIVDPQQMRLQEQMQLLSEAQVVVGLHGAALTNIIFCQPQTLVVELRSSHKPPEHYSEIASTCQLQFEKVSLTPERKLDKPHLALQAHLILTDQSMEDLLRKLQVCEV